MDISIFAPFDALCLTRRLAMIRVPRTYLSERNAIFKALAMVDTSWHLRLTQGRPLLAEALQKREFTKFGIG